MSQKKPKRLSLARETIRLLTDKELIRAGGARSNSLCNMPSCNTAGGDSAAYACDQTTFR